MVSSSSEGRASKMSIVRRRSVTRMLAVAPGLPIGGGQVWFTSNNANRGCQVPGAFERISILRGLLCQIRRRTLPGFESLLKPAFGEDGGDQIVNRGVIIGEDGRLGFVQPLMHQVTGHDVGDHRAIGA